MQESNVTNSTFATGVCTAGDVNGDGYDDILVSAPGWSGEGRVVLYLGSASGLSSSPAWVKDSGEPGSSFGSSTSPAGDVNGDGYDDVIIGAPGYGDGTHVGRGYLFLGSVGGLSETPLWTIEGPETSFQYGTGAGLAGDVNGDGYSDILFSGISHTEATVFLYYGAQGGPDTVEDWWLIPENFVNAIGRQVFAAGDVNGDAYSDVAISDPWWEGAGINSGRVLLFEGSSDGLYGRIPQVLPGQGSGNLFGTSVRPAGDVDGDGFGDLIASAPEYTNGQTQEGKVYVFRGRPDRMKDQWRWRIESDVSNGRLGQAVALGDWNRDGIEDVAVGGYGLTNGDLNEGEVLVYLGSRDGVAEEPVWSGEGDQAGACYGYAVANAGDVNGDGYEDLLVGAPCFDGGEVDEGRALLYLGSAGGPAPTAVWTAEGNAAGALFGYSVAAAGDVNGDGYADVLVGAPEHETGLVVAGAAYLYLGSASGLGSLAWSITGIEESEALGASIACAGDVNGDGLSDILIGSPGRGEDQFREGVVLVFHGSENLSSVPDAVLHESTANASYGRSVASAGDVNADGYSDVIVGSPAFTGDISRQGAVFLYMGAASGLETFQSFYTYGSNEDASLGVSVAGADMNGDGYGDLVMSAPFADLEIEGGGGVYVRTSSPTGPGGGIWMTLTGDQSNSRFGESVACRGDANGDGWNDIVVGAPTHANGQTAEGRCFFYSGQLLAGLDRPVSQERIEGTARLALLNASDATDGFDLRMLLRTPVGRGRVKFQYQVVPAGSPFPGLINFTAAAWRDTGEPVAGLGSARTVVRTVSGLTPDTAYHWRVRYHFDSPYFGASRWLTLAGNSVNETDLRTASAATDVAAGVTLPRSLELEPRPNPWTSSVEVRFDLPRPARARLTVHDALGRRIASLLDREVDAGAHVAAWSGRASDGRPVPAGAYFLRLEAEGRERVVKTMRLR